MPSPAESPLEAGLVALKQGNYYTAIAQLEPIAKSQGKGNAALQAKVGLVMAYARTGQASKALSLCEHLAESSNLQVQEWAKRALEQLIKRQQRHRKSQKIATGLVSFDHSHLTTLAPHHLDEEEDLQTEPAGVYWRHARRAKVWQPLGKQNLMPSRLIAAGTFLVLFWVCREMLKFGMGLINQIFTKLPYLKPIQFLYSDPSAFTFVILLILMGLSPWLLDQMLTKWHGQQELSKETLHCYSREAVRVVQRTCQQQRWQLPKLKLLPMSAPLMLTYGNAPRTARIVVSQGLLEQLTDEEIAAIYAVSLGQINYYDLMVMSLVLLVTLPVYILYQRAAAWGNNVESQIWSWPATILASLAYGIWSLFTSTALLNSRWRLYHSDRRAAEITGNPNGIIRALLKMAIGIANDITKQGHTSWQLESLNLLAPISYQQSLSLGSSAGHLPFESFLMWENANPYRRWFTINNSHPLIGDRLERLCQIARHWHLDTELHLTHPKSCQVKPQLFLLQIAPWLGIPLGILFAGLIWLVWQTAYTLHLLNLKWIYDDWSFLTGCLLIGFSIGTVMRINSLFPDIQPPNVRTNNQLPKLLADPSVLPIDSINVRLVGKLLGRPGTGNCLAQDLVLQSNKGLVKLHHIPWLGQSVNPQDWIGRQIIVTGWLRRGATPWIDIQTLETQSGKTINSPHPIWSTVLAVAAQALGAYIVLTG
jgi:Zn-dependent protease with chaperone function